MATEKDLIGLIQSEDPTIALESLRAMRQLGERHERRAVAAARRAGFSWQEIAEALGRQRSSVWERYHSDDPGSDDNPV